MRLLAASALMLFAVSAQADEPKPFDLKSKDGRFTVTFPSKPMETTQKVPLAGTDKEITVTNHVVEVGKGAAFIVAYNDYPEGVLAPEPQDTLKGVRDGNMGPNAKLGQDKEGTFGPNKLPMREITFTKNSKDDKGNDITLHFRNKLILDGTRLYQVMIVADNAKTLTNDTAKTYYESFKLAKKRD